MNAENMTPQELRDLAAKKEQEELDLNTIFKVGELKCDLYLGDDEGVELCWKYGEFFTLGGLITKENLDIVTKNFLV